MSTFAETFKKAMGNQSQSTATPASKDMFSSSSSSQVHLSQLQTPLASILQTPPTTSSNNFVSNTIQNIASPTVGPQTVNPPMVFNDFKPKPVINPVAATTSSTLESRQNALPFLDDKKPISSSMNLFSPANQTNTQSSGPLNLFSQGNTGKTNTQSVYYPNKPEFMYSFSLPRKPEPWIYESCSPFGQLLRKIDPLKSEVNSKKIEEPITTSAIKKPTVIVDELSSLSSTRPLVNIVYRPPIENSFPHKSIFTDNPLSATIFDSAQQTELNREFQRKLEEKKAKLTGNIGLSNCLSNPVNPHKRLKIEANEASQVAKFPNGSHESIIHPKDLIPETEFQISAIDSSKNYIKNNIFSPETTVPASRSFWIQAAAKKEAEAAIIEVVLNLDNCIIVPLKLTGGKLLELGGISKLSYYIFGGLLKLSSNQHPTIAHLIIGGQILPIDFSITLSDIKKWATSTFKQESGIEVYVPALAMRQPLKPHATASKSEYFSLPPLCFINGLLKIQETVSAVGFTAWNGYGKVAWQQRVKFRGKIDNLDDIVEISPRGVFFKPHDAFNPSLFEVNISMTN